MERQQALDRLAEMVRFDTRTETPGESDLARWLVDAMHDLGLDADLHQVSPGRFNAVGTWRGTGGGRTLLFNGHLDTNPATEGWTVDPWGGLVDDEFIYGLGVSNMKAGCASYLQAVAGMVGRGIRLAGDVVLTFVVGELQGGVGTLRLIEDGLSADWFINCEPTDLAALTTHAGAFDFEVELTGRTRHSSKREEAADALVAAADLVPRINQMTFAGASDDDHRAVNRAHVGVLEAALGRSLEQWRPPQVADFARMLGTCRYGPAQSVEGVLADLASLVQSTVPAGVASHVVRHDTHDAGAHMPPFQVPRDAEIVTALNAAHRAVRGTEQRTGAVRPYCFYGSDAAHLAHAGIPGVVCGPGGRYNTMPDERVDIPDYLDLIAIHTWVMEEICGRVDVSSPATSS